MTKTNKKSIGLRRKHGSQSPFLKGWFARKRDEERRRAEAERFEARSEHNSADAKVHATMARRALYEPDASAAAFAAAIDGTRMEMRVGADRVAAGHHASMDHMINTATFARHDSLVRSCSFLRAPFHPIGAKLVYPTASAGASFDGRRRVMPALGIASGSPDATRLAPTDTLTQTDLFGRSFHRHRDAVREAGRNTPRTTRLPRLRKFLWPLIGRGFTAPDARSFDWTVHTHAFDQGSPVAVYVSTCTGACILGSEAKLPVAKIGVSERTDLVERMNELNAVGYGSVVRDPLGSCRIEPSFDDWHPLRLNHAARPEHDSPVEWSPTRLLVSLPRSLSVEKFDLRLKEVLAPSAVFDWGKTPDGMLHCARARIDPRRLQRYSAYPDEAGSNSLRISMAEELYCFRSAHDPAELVRIIEGIIALHLLDEADHRQHAAIRHAATQHARGRITPVEPGRHSVVPPRRANGEPDRLTGLHTTSWVPFWSMTLKVTS